MAFDSEVQLNGVSSLIFNSRVLPVSITIRSFLCNGKFHEETSCFRKCWKKNPKNYLSRLT